MNTSWWILSLFTVHKKVEVLELCDLQREYILVDSRLKLAKRDPDPMHLLGPGSTVEESVGVLVNAGLFDVAARLCQVYKIKYTHIFEGLAAK